MAGARQSLRCGTDGFARIRRRLWSDQPCRSPFDARDRFSFSEFLPGAQVKKVQIDQNPKHIGRRTSLDLGLVGDVKATLQALLENVREKTDDRFLRKYVGETESFAELKRHYVDNGPGIKPIRPEYLADTLCKLASDDAMFFADTGTAVMWLARHIKGGKNRRSSDRSPGLPWPTQRRTRLARNWPILAAKRSPSAATAGSRCLGWAIC